MRSPNPCEPLCKLYAIRMPCVRLNARTITSAKPRSEVYSLFDETTPGFHVRIKPTGQKSFFLKHNVDGRQRMLGLGSWPAVTVEEARKLALAARAQVAKGGDPVSERKRRRADLTVSDFLTTFMDRHVSKRLKPRTRDQYQWLIDKYLAPALGRIRLGVLEVADIAKLHHALGETPRTANQCVRLVGKAMERAASWGYVVKVHSVRGIELYPETKRVFRLELASAAKLSEAMETEMTKGNKHAVAGIRLLLLTGMRLGELIGLRWDQVNFDRGALNLEDSKTGAKAISLSKPALKVLQALHEERRLGQQKVMDWKKDSGALIAIRRAWQRIRTKAELPEMRIHDIRHAFASAALDAGQPLEAIAKLLGQSMVSTTERYAHLGEGRAQAGAKAAGAAMVKLLQRKA